MRYIRLLKTPKLQDNSLKATITVTSDLGETFLNEHVQLAATLRSADAASDIQARKIIDWKPGMRALQLSFPLTGKGIRWPCVLHVAEKNAPDIDRFDNHEHASGLPNIISAWSDTLNPTKDISAASRTVERRFQLVSNSMLRLWEETGESIARHLWDGGIALTAYLDRKIAHESRIVQAEDASFGPNTRKKLEIIELGCGCGMVGIALAQLIPDCNVLLTDVVEAQNIANRNIANLGPAKSSQLKFMPLDWELPLPKTVEGRIFDLLIVSECTYNTDTIPALVKTLQALITLSPIAFILLSTKVRHSSESMFFEAMEQAGLVHSKHDQLPLPQDRDFDAEPEIVHVYRFHHKLTPIKDLAVIKNGGLLARVFADD